MGSDEDVTVIVPGRNDGTLLATSLSRTGTS